MTALHHREPADDPAPVHRVPHDPNRRRRSTAAPAVAFHGALSHRDRAILRAVDVGTAELALGAEPALYLDGRYCSDQFAAHRLARAGLIAAAGPGPIGHRVRARLTRAGRARLAA